MIVSNEKIYCYPNDEALESIDNALIEKDPDKWASYIILNTFIHPVHETLNSDYGSKVQWELADTKT